MVDSVSTNEPFKTALFFWWTQVSHNLSATDQYKNGASVSVIPLHLLHNLVISLLHLGYNFYTRNVVLVVQNKYLLEPLYGYLFPLNRDGTFCDCFYYLKNLNNLNNLKYLNHHSFSSSNSFSYFRQRNRKEKHVDGETNFKPTSEHLVTKKADIRELRHYFRLVPWAAIRETWIVTSSVVSDRHSPVIEYKCEDNAGTKAFVPPDITFKDGAVEEHMIAGLRVEVLSCKTDVADSVAY